MLDFPLLKRSFPSLYLVQVTGGVDDDIGLVEKRGGFGGHTSGGGLQRWARFLHACACISKLAYSYISMFAFHFVFFLFRSDSPTVEASVVLFSLETLIITVSAGAVAALVVGFVTGGDHHHQHHHFYWSSSRREICQMFHTTLSLFCHNHHHHHHHCCWSSSSMSVPLSTL